MTEELEDIEKQFILNEDMEHEDIEEFIKRILSFCKIDSKGFVRIQKPDLIIPQKIMLVLSARYLANKLQEKLGKKDSISEKVSAEELSNMLRSKKSVIVARVKDLKDSNKLNSPSKGTYQVSPYAIEDFLDELEKNKNE